MLRRFTDDQKKMHLSLGFYRKKRVTADVETINTKETNMSTSTSTSTNIPAPTVTDWGFWGTMKEEAPAAWAIALPAIAMVTGTELDAARAFLDSRHGRHFADEVRNHLLKGKTLADAIDAAITEWMGWTIGRQASKQYGIPRGLPYLTGFVVHCGIIEEAAQTQQ
jgi:hypothetical protein